MACGRCGQRFRPALGLAPNISDPMSDLTVELVRQGVIVLLTVTAGSMGGVLRLHYKAWRKSPSGTGILPLHVFMVSLAQLCFVIGAAVGILNDLANPLSYRFWLYIAGCIITLISLHIIGKFQRVRLANLPPTGKHFRRDELGNKK